MSEDPKISWSAELGCLQVFVPQPFLVRLIEAVKAGSEIELCDEEDDWYVQRPAYVHVSDLIWRKENISIRIKKI